MWDYILTWLTPTSLFLLLNLTIATIVISHRFHTPPRHQDHAHPSLLQRVTSLDISRYNFQHAHHHENPNGTIVRAPSLLQRVTSFNYSGLVNPSEGEHVTQVTCTTLEKPKGIVNPSEDVHVTKYVHMVQCDEGHHEEEGLPEKVVMRKRRVVENTTSFGDDEGVDAKADDFINRFKQQLKLQRLDSLLRYKLRNAQEKLN